MTFDSHQVRYKRTIAHSGGWESLMYAYASQLGRFYDNVFAFQCQVDSLERSIERLMTEARSVEQRLEGADTLVNETQSRFRRLTSDFFCRSGTIARALQKPRGYAGDHGL